MQLLCRCSGSDFFQRLSRKTHSAVQCESETCDGFVNVYDDYAHHPTEVAATLSAMYEKHPNTAVIAVWQPVSRLRLMTFMKQFALELRPAAGVIIAPLDTSREATDPQANAVLMNIACKYLNGMKPSGQVNTSWACTAHTSESIIKCIEDHAYNIRQHSPCTDIAVLFMGSGDITDSACMLSEILA